MQHIGKILIVGGIILIIAGLLIVTGGNKLSWIGKLPGDIRVERENFTFYFPITTMILFSLILTGILWIIRKLF